MALGEARWKEGNFQSAFDWLNEALALARDSGALDEECLCLTRLGRLCWALGKPDDSRQYYNRALAEAGRLNSPKLTREVRVGLKILELYALAKSERAAGRLDGSIQDLEAAVKWARRLGSPEHEVKCLRQLSLSRLAKGERETFFDLNRRALTVARNMWDRGEQAKCLLNLGTYDFGAKNFSRALNDYSEAAELAREVGNRLDELASLKNIATILLGLGFYERAADYFQSAYEIDRQSENAYQATDLLSLGQAYRNRGLILSVKNDIFSSVDFFCRALDLARAEGDSRTQVISLGYLGQSHVDLGNYHTALHYLEEAIQLAQEVNDPEATVSVLKNLGICCLRMGSVQIAEGYFEKALDLTERRQTSIGPWEILFYLGQCHERQGHNEQAIACYRNSIDAIDYIRSRIRLDEFKAGFARNKAKVYESLVSLLLRQRADAQSVSRNAEIFGVVEQAKARAFLETLAAARNATADEQSGALREPRNQLSEQIAALISRLSRLNQDRRQKLELEKNLRQREEEYLRLLSRSQAELEGADGLVSLLPAGLDRIQERLLDEKTAVLEYFLGTDSSLVLLITKDALRLIPLPSAEAIESSLGAYARLLSEPPDGEWNGTPAGRRLFDILLSGAFASLPPKVEHLIIVPDGALTGLPFETLPLPAAGPAPSENYLVSKYSVSYGASCSSLLFLKESGRKGGFAKDLLAIGDPVYPRANKTPRKSRLSEAGLMQDLYASQGFRLDPLGKSRDEIKRIAALFPKRKVDVYLEKDATEGRLKSLALENYQAIHIACHAYQDEKVPFRSGLFLSLEEAQDEDGFLYAREVAALRFRAELVVLSACRTSGGYVERGEGTMGLPRVFFCAGARSVVSSLWEVSDRAAAEFMPRFYRHLKRGESKTEALRAAKLEMLGSKYSHPFFWSAFVLAGEPFGGIAAD
jgi:CHAT domain-containing protein/tetratricopeptide (TPR) repeat protein